MRPHVSVVTLGVRDVARAREFYHEGLGWPVQYERGPWARFAVGGGAGALDLFQWDGLAADAGVAAAGDGFRGVALGYLVPTEARVDEVLAEAERAGGRIVRAAENPPWGGRFGYFADPDGHLWKITGGAGAPELMAE